MLSSYLRLCHRQQLNFGPSAGVNFAFKGPAGKQFLLSMVSHKSPEQMQFHGVASSCGISLKECNNKVPARNVSAISQCALTSLSLSSMELRRYGSARNFSLSAKMYDINTLIKNARDAERSRVYNDLALGAVFTLYGLIIAWSVWQIFSFDISTNHDRKADDIKTKLDDHKDALKQLLDRRFDATERQLNIVKDQLGETQRSLRSLGDQLGQAQQSLKSVKDQSGDMQRRLTAMETHLAKFVPSPVNRGR